MEKLINDELEAGLCDDETDSESDNDSNNETESYNKKDSDESNK